MKLEHKSFYLPTYEIKEDSENENRISIEGYGAVFNNEDKGGDVIEAGAFDKTLSEGKDKVPFLQDHEYSIDYNLGIAYLSVDENGLKGRYEINLSKQKGREAYELAKQYQNAGLPLGLSIGYYPVKADYDKLNDVRRLKELKLVEVSLTAFPMNEKATVTSAKSIKEIEQQITELKDALNSLKTVEPLQDTQDFDAEMKKAIEQLKTTIKGIK